jgi:EF-P beta-lysylation protein EpmB
MQEQLPAIDDDAAVGPAHPDWSNEASDAFPFLVPQAYRQKIAAGTNPQALLRQVLPVAEELADSPGYSKNPLAEHPGKAHGLIEKYRGRLLVMVTQACAGHCRFCFRRHMLDSPNQQELVQAAFRQRMARRDDITEVILSGGDPLVVSDRKLASWIELISAYPQVRRIRIHSREPVFSPERFTPERLDILRQSPLPVILAVHVNHADELDGETAGALQGLREAGVMLLTQTVLLRGVNDSLHSLVALFERSVDCGLVPYYLHQLDRVAGAAHFEVDSERGLELVDALRDHLPGYMVPRFVREIPGAAGKTPLG